MGGVTFSDGSVAPVRVGVRPSAADVNFEEHEKTLRPHLDAAKCAVKQAPRTGNSPALMHRDDLKKVSPSWAKISVALHGDMEACCPPLVAPRRSPRRIFSPPDHSLTHGVLTSQEAAPEGRLMLQVTCERKRPAAPLSRTDARLAAAARSNNTGAEGGGVGWGDVRVFARHLRGALRPAQPEAPCIVLMAQEPRV